jgi:SAM-dependent methyltransferase
MDPPVAAALLQRVLPVELQPSFPVSFIRSDHLYSEFIARLVLQVFRDSALSEAIRELGSTDEIAARAKLDPGHALVPLDWMLRFLAARDLVEEVPAESCYRYRSRGALPALDPAPVREEQRRHDPSWMPAYVLAESVAQEYPAFLRGEVRGDEVLFSARRLRLWVDYFSNDNGLYAVNNRVGAVAVEQWLPRPGSAILELGGGLASGALAVLERLKETGRISDVAGYHFTEFVPAFLRRGEHTLRTRCPDMSWLTFGGLDMNRSFTEQGVAPGSVSVVYAVNTLHVAHDLTFTLTEVRRALEPGGRLVISECMRARPQQAIHAEFVFNLTETFRSPLLDPVSRPTGGFLTPAQWARAVERAGFTDIRFLPDIVPIQNELPEFIVAAMATTRLD